MQTKAQWMTRTAVWVAILVGALITVIVRGEVSVRGFALCAAWVSLAIAFVGLVYFVGGVMGDAFPPHTAIDVNAAQGLRGQPLDHGRGALAKPTFGGVVMVAAAVPAVVALAFWYLISR